MEIIDKTKLQNWMDEHRVKDTMIWKDPWVKRVCLLRDRIIQTFNDDYEVVGEHMSKSILCPVIKTLYKDVEIIWQFNFHYWQIMIKSPYSIKLDNLSWYNANGDYFYYQGIPEEYRFKKYDYETNNKKFAIDIDDDILDVWAFALELKRVIDIEWSKQHVEYDVTTLNKEEREQLEKDLQKCIKAMDDLEEEMQEVESKIAQYHHWKTLANFSLGVKEDNPLEMNLDKFIENENAYYDVLRKQYLGIFEQYHKILKKLGRE